MSWLAHYYYRKNLQGDVISILDSYGATVVSYVYDSWGKVISIKDPQGNDIIDAGHIANKNPIRIAGILRYRNEPLLSK